MASKCQRNLVFKTYIKYLIFYTLEVVSFYLDPTLPLQLEIKKIPLFI